MTQKKLQWIIAAVCGGLLVIATVVTLAMGGGGGSGYPPGRGPVSREEMGWHPFGGGQEDEDLAEVTRMKDAMCACKDEACAREVQEQFDSLLKDLGQRYSGDKTPPKELMDAAEALMKCESEAMTSGSGSTAP